MHEHLAISDTIGIRFVYILEIDYKCTSYLWNIFEMAVFWNGREYGHNFCIGVKPPSIYPEIFQGLFTSGHTSTF